MGGIAKYAYSVGYVLNKFVTCPIINVGSSTYENTVKQWSPTHAFLHEMEGFKLIVHPSARSQLPYYAGNCHARDLIFLAKRRQISLAKIASDIRDRSKGDWVSKALTSFQATWFLIQFGARAAQGLPITELEISTVGLVMVALSTYAFWWHKPLNVNIPVAIHISGAEYPELMAFRDREVTNPSRFQPIQINHPIQMIPQHAPVSQRAIGPVSALVRPWPSEPAPPRPAPQSFRGVPQAQLFNPVMNPGHPANVPAPKRDSHLRPGMVMWCCLASVGFVLGGIHCAAWSFHFPTVQERTMWRICSVIVTTIPPILTATFIYLWVPLDNRLPRHFFREWFLYVAFGLFLIVYVVARVALLVEAFLCLRSMPAGVHQTVQWTTFLPHI